MPLASGPGRYAYEYSFKLLGMHSKAVRQALKTEYPNLKIKVKIDDKNTMFAYILSGNQQLNEESYESLKESIEDTMLSVLKSIEDAADENIYVYCYLGEPYKQDYIYKNAETKELKKDSCCCGATKSKPCACMYEGIMSCSAKAPMCACYKELAAKKGAETMNNMEWLKNSNKSIRDKSYNCAYDCGSYVATKGDTCYNCTYGAESFSADEVILTARLWENDPIEKQWLIDDEDDEVVGEIVLTYNYTDSLRIGHGNPPQRGTRKEYHFTIDRYNLQGNSDNIEWKEEGSKYPTIKSALKAFTKKYAEYKGKDGFEAESFEATEWIGFCPECNKWRTKDMSKIFKNNRKDNNDEEYITDLAYNGWTVPKKLLGKQLCMRGQRFGNVRSQTDSFTGYGQRTHNDSYCGTPLTKVKSKYKSESFSADEVLDINEIVDDLHKDIWFERYINDRCVGCNFRFNKNHSFWTISASDKRVCEKCANEDNIKWLNAETFEAERGCYPCPDCGTMMYENNYFGYGLHCSCSKCGSNYITKPIVDNSFEAESFNVEFNEWADQEMMTHGKDISFNDWSKDEGLKHGNSEITEWAQHEDESHDARYGAETFEADRYWDEPTDSFRETFGPTVEVREFPKSSSVYKNGKVVKKYSGDGHMIKSRSWAEGLRDDNFNAEGNSNNKWIFGALIVGLSIPVLSTLLNSGKDN